MELLSSDGASELQTDGGEHHVDSLDDGIELPCMGWSVLRALEALAKKTGAVGVVGEEGCVGEAIAEEGKEIRDDGLVVKGREEPEGFGDLEDVGSPITRLAEGLTSLDAEVVPL